MSARTLEDIRADLSKLKRTRRWLWAGLVANVLALFFFVFVFAVGLSGVLR